MAQITVDSRTTHTIHITLTDDVLAQMDSGNDIEVILHSRIGNTLAKKLSYRDVRGLLEGFPK